MSETGDKIRSFLGMLGFIAFVASFVFPGVRIAGVPVSISSLLCLLFVPLAPLAFSRRRGTVIVATLAVLILLICANALRFGAQVRDVMYLLIPLSSVGAVAMVKVLADCFGIATLQRWGMGLCLANVCVMLAQAMDLGGVNESLAALWRANIAFVASTPEHAEILELTVPIRPPGLFPTGIFASTFIYVVCRSVYLYSGKAWPLLLALLSIAITANRTLFAIFLVYESFALLHRYGAVRFVLRGVVATGVAAALLVLASVVSGELYLFQFLSEEVAGGSIESSASVVERLKTWELFLAHMPSHFYFGGFSSAMLAAEDHVFDSEWLLRLLQFGVLGTTCLALVILVPRSGKWWSAWNFLFFLAALTAVTTTFATSLVYVVAIAFYKEVVVRIAEFRQPLVWRQSSMSPTVN